MQTVSQRLSSVEAQEQRTCQGTHIFLARGYNEEYPGRQKVLVNAICSGLTSDECGYEDILFDDMEGSVYGNAVYEGVTAGKSQITAYVKDCPSAKLVLSGYSLGAHVVGDMLGGNGGAFTIYGTVEPEVDGFDSAKASPGSHRQSYNVGSGADKNSYYPRSGAVLEKMGAFASVLRSYCVSTDPVCAQGDDVSTHLDYFQKSADDAAKWVRSMVDKTDNDSAATSASGTVAASSRAASGTASTVLSATTGAALGGSNSTSISSWSNPSTEAGASTTAAAMGSATTTAPSGSGVATFSRKKVLVWLGMMMASCFLVGQ
ncbi:hypothetical protein N8I77_001585 [Diaporthe amygdali]|uniref:Cutinase n=1 Tax=Phomopsis amygdali TaxID=1214568 RepID=A0AAD9SPC2_PHOAM|nr:hypothetical protein N8I77_001585 [Diaporthe amygdali]